MFEIPSGHLAVLADLSVRGSIRTSLRSEDKIRAAVEAVSRLGPPLFRACNGFRRDGDVFQLSWPAVGGEARSLLDLVPTWRGYPAVHLPEALDLARFVYRACSEMDCLRPLRFLFSPLQVCRVTKADGRGEWAIVPL